MQFNWIDKPCHIKIKYLCAISTFIIAISFSSFYKKKEYDNKDLYVSALNLFGFIILSWYNINLKFKEGFLLAFIGVIICLYVFIQVKIKIHSKE